MRYLEFVPSPELARFVNCIWTLKSKEVSPAAVERIIPDGSPELVINRGDRFLEIDDQGRAHRQPEILIAGQLGGPLLIAPSGRVDLIGVRFRPAGLYPLLGGMALSEINGQRVDLADVDRPFCDAVQEKCPVKMQQTVHDLDSAIAFEIVR